MPVAAIKPKLLYVFTTTDRPDKAIGIWLQSLSITFDIKAFNDEVHLALTGAPSAPVLRNAAFVGNHAKEKLWEYRILVIPGIDVEEIEAEAKFKPEAY